MSVTLSLNKQCARCPRVEQIPVTIDEAVKAAQKASKAPKALEVKIDGETVAEFPALCSTCVSIVQKYMDKITKPQKHISSLRESGTDVEVDAG
jgi:hypothetical protein